MAPVRRLTAMLIADVAGYSRLMGADEEGTHERLKGHLLDLVNPKIEERRGRIVKNTGDGFLAEFVSVVDAVHCAVEIQRGMMDREAELPERQRILFRIGVNLGDVIAEEHDIFGDGVNIAARLQALAEPAGICLSQVARDQVRGKLDFAFEDLGEQRLRNITRPIRVYRVRDLLIQARERLQVPRPTATQDRALAGDASFTFGSFWLIPDERVLFEGERPVRLGSRAFDILVALIERAGETVSKEELIARVWPDAVVEEAALRVHVAALRKALGDGRAGKRYIANLSGRGYAFTAPVTREHALSAPAAPTGTAEVGNLPALLARVVGRDEVILALMAQLARRRFLTISGTGGIGKTTVAVAVADRVRSSYKDGAWFVGLAFLSDPDLVPSTVGAALGVPLSGGDHTRVLAAWLRDKSALLVLDNCEHLIGATAALAEAILKTAPHVSILATSREPLRAEGEWLHRLGPLNFPPPERTCPTAADALGYSAVELFNERATARMDGFVLADIDVSAMLEICRRLDGVPLALELAAARVDTFGVRELAARLDDRFGVLTSGRRTALPRHWTLRATIDWSYNLLPQAEQLILGRLSVFQGDFTMAAAAAVAADDRIKLADVMVGVANLGLKSLLITDISSELTYHRLLDMTRAYALERLSESGEVERVRRLHAEYYRDLFERAETEWEVRPPAEWLAEYWRQIDNLRAALDWAFSPVGDASIGVALTAAAVPLWMQLSLLDDCRSHAERALAVLTGGEGRDQRREMKLYAALAASSWWRAAGIYAGGDVPELGTIWTMALEIAESLGDAEYQLRSLYGLWTFQLGTGPLRVAFEIAQRFRALAAKQSAQNDRLIGERMIGAMRHLTGDQASARGHVEHMLANFITSGQRSQDLIRFQYDQRVSGLVYLARILWLQGFPDQAMRTADSAVGEARATGHALSLCYALGHAACPITLWIEDPGTAERYIAMLLHHSTRHSLPSWGALGRTYQGVLVVRRGDVGRGLGQLRAVCDESGGAISDWISVMFLTELAVGFGRAGQTADGLAAAEQAIERAEHTEARWMFSESLRIKGELLLLQAADGSATAAEAYFRLALDWARRQQALSWEMRTATSLARMFRLQHRVAEARGVLEPIYGRFTEGFATSDLREAKSLLEKLA